MSQADFQFQIRFLGDPSGQFTKDLDLTFESSAVFGNDRSKRYALVVEDGKVKSAHVEPDNTGVNGTQFIYSCEQLSSIRMLIQYTNRVRRREGSCQPLNIQDIVILRQT